MAADTWTGATSDQWQAGANWSTGKAPGAGDDATVPANTGLADIASDVGSVASLTDAGNIEFDEGSVLSAGSLVVKGGGVLHAEQNGGNMPTTIMIGAGGVSNAAGVTGVNNGVGGDISLTGNYDSSGQPTANSATMTVATQAGFGTNGHLTGEVYLSNGHIQFSSGAIQSIDANSSLTLYSGSISSGAPSDTNSGLIGLSNVAGELIVENSSVNTGSGTSAADTVTIGNHLTVSGQIAADNFVISSGGNLEITSTGSITYPPGQISSHGDVSPVTFAGGGTLTFDAAPTSSGYHTGPLVDFGIGTTLDLTHLTYKLGATAVLGPNGLLTVTSDGMTAFFGTKTPTATSFLAEPDGMGGTKVVAGIPVCFASGTSIRTSSGDVPVEQLAVGDLVVTASGAVRPIRWLGHRTVDCARHPDPRAARPVRIAAHAFAENRPARDLVVSPGHAICVDVLGETLIPAGALVNGSTIVQLDASEVTYWHVELDTHDILLAEDLPAESYLDMGNRGFFVEAGATRLHAVPDAPVPTHADFCRPFRAEGLLVEAVRRRLSRRAQALGSADAETRAA